MYDVFISYSRKDTAIADKICEALDRNNITYFIDRQGIGGAMEFPAQLADAICNSKIMLYLASKNSYKSKFTNAEITFAFNKKETGSILPYIIDGSNLPATQEFIFSAVTYRNIKDHPIDTVLINDLLKLLNKQKPSNPYPDNRNSDSESQQTVGSVIRKEKNKEDSNKNIKKLIPFVAAFVVLALVIGLIIKLSGGNGGTEQPTVEEKYETFAVDGVEFKMVFVEGGTFTMGATSEQGKDAYDDEYPTHSVTLSDYYIGETEVTQALWQAVMGSNPSWFKGNNLPVERVSYEDVKTFITKLNEKTGKTFRLPTEAEWEYAARGGKKSKGYKYSGSDNIDDVTWYYENSGDKRLNDDTWDPNELIRNNCRTHPVKTKAPNELGIYDMSGNVWEWCSDWYGDYSGSSQTNPQGPSNGLYRVYRGGSWDYYTWGWRVSCRGYDGNYISSSEDGNVGFRLALAL